MKNGSHIRRFDINVTLIGFIYRGSYILAPVLLNLLNKLGKSDKMRGLVSILSLFRNELNKFNNTGVKPRIYRFSSTLIINYKKQEHEC